MIKFIIEIIILLVVQPKKAWETISVRKESKEEYLSHFFYPLIGICTLASFVGAFIHKDTNTLESALKESTITITSLFAGFFLAAFSMKQITNKWLNYNIDTKLFQKITAYTMSLSIIVTAILELMPDFFFIRIALLYIYIIVWESVGPMIQIEEKRKVLFTAIFTAIILLSPSIIERILYSMMPGIKAH